MRRRCYKTGRMQRNHISISMQIKKYMTNNFQLHLPKCMGGGAPGCGGGLQRKEENRQICQKYIIVQKKHMQY